MLRFFIVAAVAAFAMTAHAAEETPVSSENPAAICKLDPGVSTLPKTVDELIAELG